MAVRSVKRGSTEHKDYMSKMIMAEEEREHRLRFRARQMTLDVATITLGEMGFTEEQFKKFRNLFEKTENEVAHLVVNESEEEIRNKDAVCGIWVSKDRIDRAIHAAVGDELFCPFDDRYDDCKIEPYQGKDELIQAMKRILDKKDDEIVKLKAQIKLIKQKKGGKADGST